jgi:hypothetical protein
MSWAAGSVDFDGRVAAGVLKQGPSNRLCRKDRESKRGVYTADLEYHGARIHEVLSGDQLGTGEFNFFYEPRSSFNGRISE